MKPFKAAFSFGSYRGGRWYDLDPDDPQVQGLVGAGYLIATVDVPASGAELFNGGDDHAGDGAVSADGVAVAAAPKRKRRVANGKGADLPDGEGPDGEGADHAAGGQNH